MKNILDRRSIRKFTDEKIDKETVLELLKAAMAAPSAGNEQPWEFVIVDDANLLPEFTKYHPHANMITEASWGVLVCGDKNRDKLQGYLPQDLAAATLNILLAAHAKGLGGVWLGVYPREERVEAYRKIINAPENIVPFALIAIGHPAEDKKPSNRYDESRIHHNSW